MYIPICQITNSFLRRHHIICYLIGAQNTLNQIPSPVRHRQQQTFSARDFGNEFYNKYCILEKIL
jgi:hypothetical protein